MSNDPLIHSDGVANFFTALFIGIGVISPLRNWAITKWQVSRDVWSSAFRILSVSWAACIVWQTVSVSLNQDHLGWLNKATDLPATMPVIGMSIYCIGQLAFYMAEIDFMLNRLEQRRSDDSLLLTHHFVTVFLISCYAVLGHQLFWLCTVTTMLHDISDIFLDSAKAIRHQMPRLSEILFALFALSWFALRVYYLPFVILVSLVTDANGPSVPHGYLGFGVILLLQCAQVYWTALIVKAVLKMCRPGGQLTDQRE